MILLLLTGLLGCASAQYMIMCECGFFHVDQFSQPGMPMPLDYTGNNDQVDISQCDRDVGVINDCKLYCQQYYDGAGGNQANLCDNSKEGTTRCLGSSYCESLYNNGITHMQDGVISLYYRMVECEGTAHADWSYGDREIKDTGLCCTDGQFSHCDTPCETCVEVNLCECGVFADVQFDPDMNPLETIPMPLTNIGAEFGPPSEVYCQNWPHIDFEHPCDNFCRLASQVYKANVTMQDPHNKNPAVSYGQFYCQALMGRWGTDWPVDGIGPSELETHARMPGCPIDETNDHLKWLTSRTYTCHHQELCCDGNGDRYPCPIRDLDDA